MTLKILAGQIVGLFVVFALALFLPAGTIAWPSGWIFLVLFFGFVVTISGWLLRHDPALLQERMRGTIQADQKAWDKVSQGLSGILFFAWLVLIPLDAIRFYWSQMPMWLHVGGALILLGSFYIFYLTFRENTYLSPVVRVQTERGQTVVSSGPYRYVRHPMYVAFVLFMLSTPLLLGSWWGLLVGLLLIILVARRAVLEEHTLQQELPGYAAYMGKTKYRLIPYVW